MISLLEENAVKIRALCEQYRVQRLEVFGSAATGDFQPGKSDVDFLLELEPRDPVAYGRAYFDLLFALQDLLAVSVDASRNQGSTESVSPEIDQRIEAIAL